MNKPHIKTGYTLNFLPALFEKGDLNPKFERAQYMCKIGCKQKQEAKMEQTKYQQYLIGEVVSTENNELEAVDLYNNHSYTLAPQTGITLSAGQIIQFVLADNKACDISLLASNNGAKALMYKIAAEKKLHPLFPPAVQAEVTEIISNTAAVNDPELIDLEALAFCTIDGADTMDLDQALHVEKSNDGYIVRYAIADAAYYIKPGTALFTEALKRGTSYYLPGLMVPMLPRELCVDVISLNEKVTRRAVVFEILLDHQGCHKSTEIVRARIKSCGKLSFAEVEKFLSQQTSSIRGNMQLAASLRNFKQVGLLRLKLAEERNVARFHRTEINVKLGPKGLVFNLLDNLRNEVELYNEQFSLLCNIAGAKILDEKDESLSKFIQPIYKIHPQPSSEKLSAFRAAINQLIELHSLDPEIWDWDDAGIHTLADYLKDLPDTGADKRIAQAIHRQALQINTRSSFSEQPGRHFGVGADVYARFSAPMREIVGIYVHKELIEKVVGCDNACMQQADDELRQSVIQASNRAKSIQRQLTNDANLLVLDQIFQTDLNIAPSNRPVRKATVLGLGRDKLYILLDEISIEIKLYIRPLEKLWKIPLTIDRDKLQMLNAENQNCLVRLGDEVKVSVVEKDQGKHRWIFSLMSPD